MSPTQTVAKTKPAALPALYQPPALDIDAGDVALPRIYIGQFSSGHVKDQLVKPGTIYSAAGAEDGDPQVLGEPLTFHVISLKKGKSLAEKGQPFRRWDFNDPEAPAEARTTYDYAVFLPDHETDIYYKWLLTSTATPVARQINRVLKQNEGRGPAYLTAWSVTLAKRENSEGTWFVPRVTTVEADPANVAAASALAEAMGSSTPSTAPAAASDEPSI